MNEGAARHVMAQRSTTISSGGWSRRMSSSLYHMRRVAGEPEATRQSARVVGTPIACIASDTKNSRIDERSTARPSPPREKGVVPDPLSWSSQRPLDSPLGPSGRSSPARAPARRHSYTRCRRRHGGEANSPRDRARPSP